MQFGRIARATLAVHCELNQLSYATFTVENVDVESAMPMPVAEQWRMPHLPTYGTSGDLSGGFGQRDAPQSLTLRWIVRRSRNVGRTLSLRYRETPPVGFLAIRDFPARQADHP